MTKRIVLDVETKQTGELVLVGTMDEDERYIYFSNNMNFWNYLEQNKIKEVFAHNLEFDFFKVIEGMSFKYCCHFNTSRLVYVQVKNIFFKDLYNHVPYSLKVIGYMLHCRKFKIDYEKINLITKELLRYNERDCLIVHKALQRLDKIYNNEGVSGIKSTVGSQALKIFLKRWNIYKLKRLKLDDIGLWRRGYKGGIVDAYQKGVFSGDTFYKIDVNSMYPKTMSGAYPVPYKFEVVDSLTFEQRMTNYWIGIEDEYAFNSIEHRFQRCSKYYLFTKKCYPFKDYVEYFYSKKDTPDLFDRTVYKLLLNSLYGKFGQRNESEVITNFSYKESKNIISRIPYVDNLYRIRIRDEYQKFWVNVVWALFTTAKARNYMMNLKQYLERNHFTVYYIDTDAFIVSGDIEKVTRLIDKTKLGLFKLEDMSNSIDIRGKKIYRFADASKCVRECEDCELKECIYKCKGVPRIYRRAFFNDGYVQFKKMVRFREAFVQDKIVGAVYWTHKEDKANKLST